MKDEYDLTSAGAKSIERILNTHSYHGAPMEQYLDPSDDTAGAGGSSEDVDGGWGSTEGSSIDIAYGGGAQRATTEKQVLCRPLDFSCFFGFSR